MKAGWEVKALGEVIEKVETVDPTKTPNLEFDYVDVSSVSNETFQIEQSTRTLGADAPSRARRKIRTGDVIFATVRPTLQRIAFVPPELDQQICSTGYMVLRAKPSALPKYLYYFLFSDRYSEAMEDLQKGASYPAVTDGEVRDQPIPLPPLDEQKRIVEVLDAAFEGLSHARAHTETNLQNARELFESGLEGVVSDAVMRWPSVALSALTATISDGDHAAPPKAPDGVPFITISNVDKETLEIDFSDTFKVPQAYFDALKDNRKPKQGDVLYSVTGSFGIPVHVKGNAAFCFQRHIGLVRPKPALDSRWLFFMLLSPNVYRQADEGASGTAQRTVSLAQLRSFSVPDVPFAEQVKFAAFLDEQLAKSRQLQSHYRAKLADLDALRQALLQKAFAGELT